MMIGLLHKKGTEFSIENSNYLIKDLNERYKLIKLEVIFEEDNYRQTYCCHIPAADEDFFDSSNFRIEDYENDNKNNNKIIIEDRENLQSKTFHFCNFIENIGKLYCEDIRKIRMYKIRKVISNQNNDDFFIS